MKKLFVLFMLSIGMINYSYTKLSTLTEEIDKINKQESLRIESLMNRKSKIEKELSDLQSNYNSRVEIVEKLQMDSEVRWYRDDYREILKKYETVQIDLKKEIEKKEKELSLINRGLGVIEESSLED